MTMNTVDPSSEGDAAGTASMLLTPIHLHLDCMQCS